MTTLNETYVNSFKINRLTKTQLNNATSLDPTQEYHVDPEFTGNKILSTDANGDIVETAVTNTELGYLSGTTSSIQTQLNGKASTSLDNLSAAGQMIIDSQNGTISNCILEIPQDINLTLSSGTLTLSSGSILTFADGSQYQLTSNKTSTNGWGGADEEQLIFFKKDDSSLFVFPKAYCFSGTTAPTSFLSSLRAIWYDTTNSIIKWTQDAGVTWTGEFSFPLGIIRETSGNVYSSLDQVFNGFGYIGSVSYYLPDIKILFADGINTDGTLKSIEYTTNRVGVSVSTYGCPYVIQYGDKNLVPASNKNYAEQEEQPSFTKGNWYQPSTNTMFNISNSVATKTNKIRVFDQTISSGQITSMTTRQPVRLATTEMLDTGLSKKQDVLTFDTTPTQNSTNPVISGGVYNKIFSSDIVHRDLDQSTNGYNLLTQPVNSVHSLEGTGATNSPQGDSSFYNAGLSVKFGRDDNLEAWFRGFYLYGSWNNNSNLWYGTRAAGSSGTPATTINWHPVVIADKENTFTGIQNFRKTGYSRGDLLRLYDGQQEKGTNPTSIQGAIINWSDKNGAALGLIENRYETNGRRYMRFNTRNGDCTLNRDLNFGWSGSNNGYKLTIGADESINYSLNQISTSTADCDVPTKGYINQKFTVVSTVPVSPTTGVYYFVTTGQIYYGSTLVMDANLTNYTGYDATKTQTLKNVNGTLTWVDD